jgi:TolA-binding protein
VKHSGVLASRAMRLSSCALVAALALPASGCLVLKPQHDELRSEVAKLRKEVLKASQTTSRANELADMLEKKLAELEDVLRRNQADLGQQVEQMVLDVQQLRGAAENADNRASTVEQELRELRSDLDGRLRQLEDKLNEATNIPEGKSELWTEAESQFKQKKYKNSRRLWRTYESRYPEDPKQPEVKFHIGLTYFSERDYKSALGEFYKIIQDAPNSAVVPDALYYSGLAFAKLGQCENAIAYFEALKAKKTKAPADYKQKAGEQIAILKKDAGDICMDKKAAAEKK